MWKLKANVNKTLNFAFTQTTIQKNAMYILYCLKLL
jgi:hypothetical protein